MRIELVAIDVEDGQVRRLLAWLEPELARRGISLDLRRAPSAGTQVAGRAMAPPLAPAHRLALVVVDGATPPVGDAAALLLPPDLPRFRSRCEAELFPLLDRHLGRPEGRRPSRPEQGHDTPDESRDASGEASKPEDHRATVGLVERIAKAATTRGAQLAVAESCTGGLIAATLTSVAGSSAFFLGGAVTYSNAEKTRALGVPEALIDGRGAVSEEVARAMAGGIRARTGATHALAVTGIAGPGGGSADKPVGTVWIAFAGDAEERAERHLFPGDRAEVRDRTVSAALELLLGELERSR